MKPSTKTAHLLPLKEYMESQPTLTLLLVILTHYNNLSLNNPLQLQLMPKIGNSTQVVSSVIAQINWITVSWLLVMMIAATGSLKTLGVLLGEIMDISL